MPRLLAIDPGPAQSAYVVYDGTEPERWEKCPNEDVLRRLDELGDVDACTIEMVASYGMSVGADVFETCVWAGRFIERWLLGDAGMRPEPIRVYRREVKMHLCGSARAKDANIRQALIDRYGPGKDRAIGRKAAPGPLYGLAGDGWAALALAITAAETRLAETGAAA